jgi:hypothetical protein
MILASGFTSDRELRRSHTQAEAKNLNDLFPPAARRWLDGPPFYPGSPGGEPNSEDSQDSGGSPPRDALGAVAGGGAPPGRGPRAMISMHPPAFFRGNVPFGGDRRAGSTGARRGSGEIDRPTPRVRARLAAYTPRRGADGQRANGRGRRRGRAAPGAATSPRGGRGIRPPDARPEAGRLWRRRRFAVDRGEAPRLRGRAQPSKAVPDGRPQPAQVPGLAGISGRYSTMARPSLHRYCLSQTIAVHPPSNGLKPGLQA